MAGLKISSANFAIAISIIPWLEALVAIMGETVGGQLFQNFAKFDLISVIIFIYMLNELYPRVIYPSSYICICYSNYFSILTFRLLNLLLISSVLAFKVGLFQRTCLLIHPAVFTPGLVQSSLVLCLFMYCSFLSGFLCLVKSLAPFWPNDTVLVQSILASYLLCFSVEDELTISILFLLYVYRI